MDSQLKLQKTIRAAEDTWNVFSRGILKEKRLLQGNIEKLRKFTFIFRSYVAVEKCSGDLTFTSDYSLLYKRCKWLLESALRSERLFESSPRGKVEKNTSLRRVPGERYFVKKRGSTSLAPRLRSMRFTLFDELRYFYDSQYRKFSIRSCLRRLVSSELVRPKNVGVYFLSPAQRVLFNRLYSRKLSHLTMRDVAKVYRDMALEAVILFLEIDDDNGGTISVDELALVMKTLGLTPQASELMDLKDDMQGDGGDVEEEVDFDNFCDWYFRDESWLERRRLDNDDDYSDIRIMRRAAIRFDADVSKHMDELWAVVDADGGGDLDREEYITLSFVLQDALRSEEEEPLDDETKLTAAERDWEFDSRGTKVVTRGRFTLATLQMLEAWAERLTPAAYCDFLKVAIAAVSAPLPVPVPMDTWKHPMYDYDEEKFVYITTKKQRSRDWGCLGKKFYSPPELHLPKKPQPVLPAPKRKEGVAQVTLSFLQGQMPRHKFTSGPKSVSLNASTSRPTRGSGVIRPSYPPGFYPSLGPTCRHSPGKTTKIAAAAGAVTPSRDKTIVKGGGWRRQRHSYGNDAIPSDAKEQSIDIRLTDGKVFTAMKPLPSADTAASNRPRTKIRPRSAAPAKNQNYFTGDYRVPTHFKSASGSILSGRSSSRQSTRQVLPGSWRTGKGPNSQPPLSKSYLRSKSSSGLPTISVRSP